MNSEAQEDLSNIVILSGNANPELSQRIARKMGVPLGKAQVGRFSDGEINVEILENIRGRDVFIVQSTCPPVNDNLMEMLIMADACRRASADSITAVIPYFGYARQDRRPRAARVPITAQLVASMIGAAGIDRVLTIDLHADQIQGFFPVPVDNVYASPVSARRCLAADSAITWLSSRPMSAVWSGPGHSPSGWMMRSWPSSTSAGHVPTS